MLLDDSEGHDLRPDPLKARTPQDLLQALNDFRIWAGMPGFRIMSRRISHHYAASTICTALSSDKMPRQDMVQAIVQGCGGTKEDVQLYVTAWRQIAIEMNRAAHNGERPQQP